MPSLYCDPIDLLPLDDHQPFSWHYDPYKVQDVLIHIQDQLIQKIESLRKSNRKNQFDSADVICLFAPIWMQCATTILQLCSALEEEKRSSSELKFSPLTHPFWQAYKNGNPLPDHKFIQQLIDGPNPRTKLRAILRYLKSIFLPAPVLFRPFFCFNMDDFAVVTSIDRVVVDFCEAKNLKPLYFDPDIFFRKPRATFSETREQALDIGCVTDIYLLYLNQITPINNILEKWLRHQVAQSFILSNTYISQAVEKPARLPRQLVSSLGGVWNGLLRYAVQITGGSTHVIDHGCGAAMYNFPLIDMTNFTAVDYFYAFSQRSKKFIEDALSSRPYRIFEKLKIHVFHHTEYNFGVSYQKATEKSVLFIPISPLHDRGLSSAYPMNKQAIDLNARLVSMLKKLGYQVTMKPHPAFKDFPVPFYEQKYGAPCSTQSFSDALQSHAIVITTDSTSSTTVECLLSDRPLILLNLQRSMLNEQVLNILEERAVIHNFTYLQSHQLELTSEQLENMLETAKVRASKTAFASLFSDSR